MAGELRRRFACIATKETVWGAVANWARVLFLALVFVLAGGVIVGTAMVANLGVGRAVAFGNFVSESMAT